jgi:hypothetical protein
MWGASKPTTACHISFCGRTGHVEACGGCKADPLFSSISINWESGNSVGVPNFASRFEEYSRVEGGRSGFIS